MAWGVSTVNSLVQERERPGRPELAVPAARVLEAHPRGRPRRLRGRVAHDVVVAGAWPNGAPYDVQVANLLELTAHLPERSFAPGAVVLHEGEPGDGLWVLVSGRLTVRRDGVELNELSSPGQLIGEISLLLDIPHTATVAAAEPSVLRHAADGRQLLGSDPTITMHVAVGLAERLTLLTEYVADVTRQYAHVPGISMVSAVLSRMPNGGRAAGAAAVGSRRDPDPTSRTDRHQKSVRGGASRP